MLALLVLFACNNQPVEKPEDSEPSVLQDHDGDGYLEGEDCNDQDPAVAPGSLELCDGQDNNCDGTVDEGVRQTFYADRDQDGYGDAGSPLEACEAPDGTVANNQDCDDTNEDVSPSGQEVCDGLDNDCDNVIDDGVSSTWYADNDQDGYGDPGTSTTACQQPAGFIDNDGDCNDTEATINPDGIEVCNEQDDDCDGDTDEFAQSTFYADADGDGYGDATQTTQACSAPVGFTDNNEDCDDQEVAVNPAGTEFCDGLDNDCSGLIDDNAQDATLWHLDGDGDGFAGNRITQLSCQQPSGYLPAPTPDTTDCNDSDNTIFPGATETCNGIDDDCNGSIDDGATDFTTYYADTDSDGYGDPANPTTACTPPAGYLSDNTDCNDSDNGIYPGAPEHCDDVDEDCDGVLDNDPVDPTAWYTDRDGDGYGDPATETYACNQPNGMIDTAEDCDDGDDTLNPDQIDDCDGIDNDCTGFADDAGLCPCEVVWYGDHSYQLCTDYVTWNDAQTDCEASNYSLATVEDAAEDAFLWTEVNAINTRDNLSLSYWWIGITDALVEGSFGWVGGSSTYTNWNPNEPNNLYNNEDCGHLSYEGDHWNDWNCSNTTTYICEAG